MTLALANALPEGSGDGYVAAAYVVFFVLLLVYLAIMALRLSHVQRDLRDLQARTQESARDDETRREPTRQSQKHDDETREREPA
jgi:hypothetical protein